MPEPPSAHPPRRRRQLLLLLGSLLICGLALEATLRWGLVEDGAFLGRPLPPLGAVNTAVQRAWVDAHRRSLGASEPADRLGGFDAELGWINLRSRRQHFYTTNRIAARGEREYAAQPPDGIVRVVCYGDSFTFCSDIQDAGTWPAQMEASDPRLEVINMGVASYGTDQALLWFRRCGTFGAKVAFLGVMLENIGRNLNRYRPLYYSRCVDCLMKPRFVLADGVLQLVPLPFADEQAALDAITDGSVLTRLAEHEHWRDGLAHVPLAQLATVRMLHAFFFYRARDHRGLWLDEHGEGRAVTLAIVRAFAAEAAASGAMPAVLVFPTQNDVRRLFASGESWWQPVVAALQAQGLPTIDLGEPLRDFNRQGRTADSLFAGGHFTAEVNGALAAHLRRWLSERVDGLR